MFRYFVSSLHHLSLNSFTPSKTFLFQNLARITTRPTNHIFPNNAGGLFRVQRKQPFASRSFPPRSPNSSPTRWSPNRQQKKQDHGLWIFLGGFIGVPVGLGMIVYYHNQEIVPVSNRKRFIFTSLEQEKKLGNGTYKALKEEYARLTLPEDCPSSQRVRRVGLKLGSSSRTLKERKYLWKFLVVDNKDVANAFVLPNGKCFIFTGLLDLCETDDELAAILSHELAHVIARHTGEKISNEYFFRSVLVVGCILVGIDPGWLMAGQHLLVSLPQSRLHEREADRIGILLANKAGFDPNGAVKIWEKMAKANKSSLAEKFLSTHPTSEDRVKDMRKWAQELDEKNDHWSGW